MATSSSVCPRCWLFLAVVFKFFFGSGAFLSFHQHNSQRQQVRHALSLVNTTSPVPQSPSQRRANLTREDKDDIRRDIQENIKDEIREEIEEDFQRELRDDIEKDVEQDLKKELKKDLEVDEKKIEKEVEQGVKADLAKDGLSAEEDLAPVAERVLERAHDEKQELDAKWIVFQWCVVVFLLALPLVACLAWLAPAAHYPLTATSQQDSQEDQTTPHSEPSAAEPSSGFMGIGDWLGFPHGTLSAFCLSIILAPLGIVVRLLWSHHNVLVFGLNMLAIIPESYLLGVATEEIAMQLGDAAGGLLNASFGNAVELIFVYFTLHDGLVDACVGSIVGSILSNHLVLLGICFLVGGVLVKPPFTIRLSKDASFDVHRAMDQSQQLMVSSFSVTLPAVFARLHNVTVHHVLVLSQAFSVFLILSYVALVFYQLQTSTKAGAELTPAMSTRGAFCMLAVSTVMMAISSECMVESLDAFCSSIGLSQTFVGVVLMPIAGDFSHMSAIYLAMKGKMDLAINISLASAIQIALVVVPASITMGHLMDQPMTLGFHAVHGVTLILSAIITFAVLVDGHSNWLRGHALLTTFALVCAVVFFMPDLQRSQAYF